MLEAEQAERCASCAIALRNNVGQDFSLSSALLASLLPFHVLLRNYIMMIKVDYFMNQSASQRNGGTLPNPFPPGWQFHAFRLIPLAFICQLQGKLWSVSNSCTAGLSLGMHAFPQCWTSSLACSLKNSSKLFKYCCGLNCVLPSPPEKDVQTFSS